MKIVIFGLTISSSWGNGHATLWRGLCTALIKRGHKVVFFERDVPYYASSRDLTELAGGELILYASWEQTRKSARRQLADADVGIVTSYCPDALAAGELLHESNVAARVFYDLDAPVTLARLACGEVVDYVGPRGYRDYDLVLSYTGGKALEQLQSVLGAERVAPLYGSVDPAVHKPVAAEERYRADLSYMGTWSADRQQALHALFVEPAIRLPERRFMLGGSKYGSDFPWLPNMYFLSHVAPAEHPAFYCSSRVTLNVTRKPMAEMGYCPSGRLFEAAACAVPILSDQWKGLESYYTPGEEILVASSCDEAVAIITGSAGDLAKIGHAARERTLACHTADVRAVDFERILESHKARELVNVACGA